MSHELDPYMAYCAGLFEGEGYVGTQYSRQKNQVNRQISIRICMTDREPLDMFAELTDIGTVKGPYRNGGNSANKPIYEYRVNKLKDVQFLMDEMWPWLSPRRQKQYEDALTKYKAWEHLHKASLGLRKSKKDE
jgi:hypothetical protein